MREWDSCTLFVPMDRLNLIFETIGWFREHNGMTGHSLNALYDVIGVTKQGVCAHTGVFFQRKQINFNFFCGFSGI